MALKISFSYSQSIQAVDSALRLSTTVAQNVQYPDLTSLRVNFLSGQNVEYQEALPQLRSCVTFSQYIQRAPKEAMSNDIYPELMGLTYNTAAKPMYSTDVQEHTSGKETRTQYWENARWDFTLQYDYLPNKTPSAQTDFKKLAGFFLARAGSFDTFLFKAPDDHFVENFDLGIGDGNTVEYPLFRQMGSFLEPIGQIDPDNTIVYVETIAENRTIPGSPYQIVLNHPNVVNLVSVAGYTRVDSAPGNGQYTFNQGTGTLTFSNTNSSGNVVIRYKWIGELATDYSFLLPRTLVFATAPATGDIISTTFEFFFVVRFLEDNLEFDQFMDKLWELGQVEFRSIIQ